jgi:hypothetical protein
MSFLTLLRTSKVLQLSFAHRLPNLRAETMKCLEACSQELAQLPRRIDTEPATYMLGLVTSFVNDIERFVQGGPAAGRLIQDNREAYAAFKQNIRSTAPNFLPFPKADSITSKFQNFLGEGEDEGPEEGLLSGMQPFTLADMQCHIKKFVHALYLILSCLIPCEDRSHENYLTTYPSKLKLRSSPHSKIVGN